MSKVSSIVSKDGADRLLRVAKYFRKPQRFVPIGDARAELRQTLEAVSHGSVVITTHGEPQAAIVDFETFEAVRGAVMQLLLAEMEASFNRTQVSVRKPPQGTAQTSDDELERLVGEAVHKARQEKRSKIRRRKRRK
jgi:prevent-host-death family protein